MTFPPLTLFITHLFDQHIEVNFRLKEILDTVFFAPPDNIFNDVSLVPLDIILTDKINWLDR